MDDWQRLLALAKFVKRYRDAEIAGNATEAKKLAPLLDSEVNDILLFTTPSLPFGQPEGTADAR